MGTIKSVKSSMGYIPARERTDTCAACAHFVEGRHPKSAMPDDAPVFVCSKGGFYTSRMAVCGQHERKQS